MSGKTYKAIKEKMSTEPIALNEAVAFVKTNARAKFDETVDVHVRLGVNKKAAGLVRGNVLLPHGTPKKKRVAVFTEDAAKQKAAKAAGAELVGGSDLIAKIEADGSIDVDVAIASPDMMPKIAKVAKILGPRGLMPNPKSGTVTPDVDKAVTELAGGKISFKMDQLGNIHESVGKVSWEAEKIEANVKALLEAVAASRPAGHKGEFVQGTVITATMGPGVVFTDK